MNSLDAFAGGLRRHRLSDERHAVYLSTTYLCMSHLYVKSVPQREYDLTETVKDLTAT